MLRRAAVLAAYRLWETSRTEPVATLHVGAHPSRGVTAVSSVRGNGSAARVEPLLAFYGCEMGVKGGSGLVLGAHAAAMVRDHTCAAAGCTVALATTSTYRCRLHGRLYETRHAARPARRDGLGGNVLAASCEHGSRDADIVLHTCIVSNGYWWAQLC